MLESLKGSKKNTMNLSARHTWLALTLCAAAPSVFAVGFGNLPTEAVLGQPLRLAIPLRLEPNEDLPDDCFSAQVFFAHNLQQPGTTSVRLLPAAPGAVARTLSLTTTTRVDEPFVSVEVTVGCQSRVSRRFTLFADPPVVAPAVVAAPSATEPLIAQTVPREPAADQGSSQAVPVPARPASVDQPRADGTPPQAAAPRRRLAPQVSAAAPKPARTAPRRAEAAAPALRLAPLERGARVAAAAPAPATAPAAVATTAPDPSAAAASAAAALEAAASAVAAEQAAKTQAAAAQARVAELEASLQKLRAENASTQSTVAGLQARLARAEGDPSGNPIVYALAAALAVLLGAVLWLWRQRIADREAQSWLVEHVASEHGALDAESPATAESAAFAPVPTLKTWVSKPNEVDGFDDTLALTRAGVHNSTLPAPFVSRPTSLDSIQPLAAEAQKREVSVEELIDLEQQAEFFVVLGQDSAAIDLLMGHLRSTSGTSPLPYLKLLEIYKRLGERDDYERLRERFNRRFNAYAPSWETDLLGGRSLDEYPAVIERLQSLWVTPQRAREVLQATLVRPENTDTDPVGEDSFDLPAYRELMLLYSVIRDVSELEDADAGVDLMLPMDEDEEGIARAGQPDAAAFERLLATTTMPAQPDLQKPLEMDLALDDIEPPRPDDAASPPSAAGGGRTS